MIYDSKTILGVLNLLHEACEAISGNGGCSVCPMKTNCFELTDVLTLAEDTTTNQIDEFIGFSDDIENRMNEQDWEAYYADQARKMDIEDQMIYEKWGI